MLRRISASGRLVRWSKPTAVLAGLSWPLVFGGSLVVAVAAGQLEDSSPPPEGLTAAFWALASAFSVPAGLLILAVMGLHARYREHWGIWSSLALATAVAASGVLPFAAAAYFSGSPQAFEPSSLGDFGATTTIVGTVVLGASFVVLGAAALRSRTPSARLGVVLVAAGLFQPLILYMPVLRVLAYSVGWLAIGLALPRFAHDSKFDQSEDP